MDPKKGRTLVERKGKCRTDQDMNRNYMTMAGLHKGLPIQARMK
jgi:hypothetical protein